MSAAIAVDAVGFDTAAEAFAMANAVAAQTYQGMTRALDGFGEMAGDDKTSDEFAAGYDAAAADTMGAVGDLVAALAGLARITATTGAHHRAANAASVYSDHPPVYSGGPYDTLPDTTVNVTAYTPPASAGGDDPGTPHLWDLVTDHLEGWAWPGADTTRLRAAGTAWRQLGSLLRHSVSPYLDTAAAHLEAQRSPEVAIAIDVTRGLLLEIEQLAVHCDDLGQSCDDYAAQVEAVRAVVTGIMKDLAIEVGVTTAIAGLASIFTVGTAAGAGTAIAGWRLVAAARKVVHAFSAMKAVVRSASVARLTTIAGKVPVLRRRFQQISGAANRARHELLLRELREAMGKPYTRDPRLSEIMTELYRDTSTVGSGSTAAAVRHELATGLPVNGTFHSEKAANRIIQLQKWLKNHPDASHGDRAAAENVLRDMQDALAGH